MVKKTTLIDALAEQSDRVVPESARRIIKERLAAGLSPRPNLVSFAQEILSSDIEKYWSVIACKHATLFERGVLHAYTCLLRRGR